MNVSRLRLIIGIALVVLFSTAVLAQESPQFVPVSGDCFVAVESAFEYDCGQVSVPEEHAKADNGRTVTLGVVRVKSTSDAPGTPMFVLTGGPGGPGFGRIVEPYLGQMFTTILKHRDVVFFSQRGTAYSTPYLGCPESYQTNLQILRESLTGSDRRYALNAAIETCYKRLQAEGVNFNAFDSAENAADVNSIRQALGYDKIVLYGQSYGTILSQWVLKESPEIVAEVILDGSVGLDGVTDWGAINVRNDQFVQDRIIEDCLADAACSAAYPHIQDGFNNVIRQLAEKPITFPVVDPETKAKVTYVLDQQNLSNAVNLVARIAPNLYPALAAQLEVGDISLMTNVVSAVSLPSPDVEGSAEAVMMHYSVVCAEDPSYSLMGMIGNPTQLKHLSAYWFGMDDAENYVFACNLIDVEPLPDGNDVVPTTDLPILFLNGRLDNATVTLANEALAADFPNHYAYEFRNGSHIQLTNPANSACASAIIEAYIEAPSTAPDGTCVEQTPGVQFQLPVEATAEATPGS